MRGVAVGMMGLLLGVLTWAIVVESPTDSPAESPSTYSGSPDHLVCPLADFLRSDTQIALMASRGGGVELLRASGGEWSSYGEADLGDTGGWLGPAPSGTSVLLVESGPGWSGAGMLNIAPQSVSAWMCGESSDQLISLGGSTQADETLDLILYNPYVLDAVSRVAITSELGEDTPPPLQEIFVPAGKAVNVSIDESLRLRRFLSAQVNSSPGRVSLLLQQTGRGETAMIEGVVPHTDWWLPVPLLGQAETHLLIASPSGSPFTYRLDLFTEAGPFIGYVEEDFLPGQLVSISLSDLPDGVRGIRVSGTVALVAGLRIEGEGMLAVGPGARGLSTRWLLPGAGDDEQRENQAWLLNPSELPAAVTVSGAAQGAYSFQVTVSPESVIAFDLSELTGLAEDLPGYLVEADQEIAVVWTSQVEGKAASLVPGAPVE